MTPKTLTIRRGSSVLNDEYGAAVRQRTVRQETTTAKHGTLLEFLYQRHLEAGDQVKVHMWLIDSTFQQNLPTFRS